MSHLWLLLLLLSCIEQSLSKTAITNYATVELVENSPLNTLVIQLTTSFNQTRTSKFVLLNMIGFESNMFSIVNGSIYTVDYIDREEFLREKYCLDGLYCKIELHVLVDGGQAYWVIPVHIVDENDNKPEFAQHEIELRFRENVVNGYKIPFAGARDLDESRNGEIHYVLDCSPDVHTNKTFINQYIQSSINCFPLFQLMVLSQLSSSTNYDRLALKFLPSTSVNIQNDYRLRLYAIDNSENGKQLDDSMMLTVRIERREKPPRFTLSEYDFVVTINSSARKNESLLGRVHAVSNDPSQVVHYRLLSDSLKIRINSLTGEIILVHDNVTRFNHEIEFFVQAFTLSKEKPTVSLTTRSKVKILFRYVELLNNITYQFQTISSPNGHRIRRLNTTSSFLLDEQVQSNEDLLKIALMSLPYPADRYILSLDNYLATFSLVSTVSLNTYVLRTRRRPAPQAIYTLTIGVKHRLSQQWLPNLRIELIVVDQRSTSTMTSTIPTTITTTPTIATVSVIITNTTIYVEPEGFCIENKRYILEEVRNESVEDKIALLSVIESNLLLNQSQNAVQSLISSTNQSELLINGCRMRMDRADVFFNESLQYQICSLAYDSECYNVSLAEDTDAIAKPSSIDLHRWLLPMKPIEIVMFTLSVIFIAVTFVLMLLICRLKGVHVCLTMKNYFMYGKKYGINNPPHLTASPSKMTQRVHSIVIRESRSPSFEPIRITSDVDEPYIFNIDHLLDREPLPSTNMFTLPSPAQLSSSSSVTCSLQRDNRPITTPRNSSSSSFLQETKQLLELISSNPNSDPSQIASDV